MSDQIQNTLESTLPTLTHLLTTHKLTKPQISQIIQKRKLMLHRPFTKDNALRFLEYETKLDRYLRHKQTTNPFLDILYKRVITKFKDETVFTMFVQHLVGTRTTVRNVDGHSLNTLKTFCVTYLKRNRTLYLTLLMATTFYRIGDVNTGRRFFVDAMRMSTDKSIARMMMDCEQMCYCTYHTNSSRDIIEALKKEL